ncbi:putative lipid II flippase MurJ [Candidatus Hydrogenisulfobacillus filiaventi]|uniref:Probable lipid II flippase MurJ n=1 Tax=Candidatus Hydrogenisulfobacillus filiaventi TaxID=2707344 RepID=A0A6F8ZH02_9FIRM|nr:murein biosynthesis integral membrane protein MurJ [Bacillota bacterium]CAB1129066.1 putative lipid II flippase MurJ [Candidatus Hydrogenisulfobacillus filiaventi]
MQAATRKAAHHRSLGLHAAVIFVATLLSRLSGFVREIVMAYVFGTSAYTDTWLMASVLPNLLFGAINGAVTTTVVPVMSEADAGYSNRSRQHFVQEVFTLIVITALGLLLAGELAAPWLVRLIAPGFGPRKLALTVVMTRWMLPTILFWGLSGFVTGILQERERYFAPAISPVVINTVRILTILILGRLFGIVGVAIGFTLAVLSQLFVVIPPLLKLGFRLKFRWRFGHPLLRRMMVMSGPFFLASSAGTVGVIVDRILASTLVTGSLAALNYSYVLVQVPVGLLVSSLTVPIYTRLSRHFTHREEESFRFLTMKGLRVVLLIIMPITVWFILLSTPILELIYQRGAFSGRSTFLTAGTLAAFAVGLPGFALQFYLQRVFFATQDTRTPARFSVAQIAVNIAGDLLLVHPLAADGLALATGLGAWVNAFLLSVTLLRHSRREEIRRLVRPLLSLAAATVVMAGAVLILNRVLPLAALHGLWALSGGLVVTGLLSLLPYGLLLLLLRYPEAGEGLRRLAGRLALS